MKTVNTSTKKLIRFSGEDDETPVELRIVLSVTPGDDEHAPLYEISNVAISPVDEDRDPEESDTDEQVDELLAKINELRRKETGNSGRRIVRKKRRVEDRDDEDDDDQDDDSYDSESLTDADWEDDDTEELVSVTQRARVKKYRG
ncbi:hypothetical protein [Methanoregula sp.]|jgi:hypothetical protein|uniref:hypothetical protein n=1 Tax=Methanoregula sp. TaxID=2052170 RepID=UPI003C17E914